MQLHEAGPRAPGPGPNALEPPEDVRRTARLAGLARSDRPTLEDVERRRFELLGFVAFVLVALAVGMALLSLREVPFLEEHAATATVLRVTLVALVAAVSLYLLDKEKKLRQLTRALLNERALSSALVHRLKEVSLLTEAGRAVTSALDLRSTLGVILAAACDLLDADEGSIMIAEGDSLLLVAGTGNATAYIGTRKPITDGVGGYVARTRRPLLIAGEVEMTELAELFGGGVPPRDHIRSSLCVPLEVNGHLLGILSMNMIGSEHSFDEYDLHTLELFAQQAAISVYQSTVLSQEEADLRNRVAELDVLRREVIDKTIQSHGDTTDGAATPNNPAAQVATKQSQDRKTGKLHVLIADDDPGLLRFLQIALETDGCAVSLASDGRAALARIREEHPDVVLLDVTLPLLDGWRVLEELKSSQRRPRVVCLTGKSTKRDRIKAWSLGADEYVTKPFSLGRLLELVRDVAHRSRDELTDRRQEALRELFSAG